MRSKDFPELPADLETGGKVAFPLTGELKAASLGEAARRGTRERLQSVLSTKTSEEHLNSPKNSLYSLLKLLLI